MLPGNSFLRFAGDEDMEDSRDELEEDDDGGDMFEEDDEEEDNEGE